MSPEAVFFLDRFAEDGRSVGDTWHQSIDEAREQAEDEYGDALSAWHQCRMIRERSGSGGRLSIDEQLAGRALEVLCLVYAL